MSNGQSAITYEPKGSTGSLSYVHIGHAMENLFILYLFGKEGYNGLKTKMCTKSMRFCKVWPTLSCGLYIVIYSRGGITKMIEYGSTYLPLFFHVFISNALYNILYPKTWSDSHILRNLGTSFCLLSH